MRQGIPNVEARVEFGAHVRLLRDQLNLSQEALADRADIHRTYISGVELGKRNISLDLIVRLADALGVSPAAFFSSGE